VNSALDWLHLRILALATGVVFSALSVHAESPASEPILDPALVELSRKLDALMVGELSDGERLDPLFAVPLTDRPSVVERINVLAAEVETRGRQLSELRAHAARLGTDIAVEPNLTPAEVVTPATAATLAPAATLATAAAPSALLADDAAESEGGDPQAVGSQDAEAAALDASTAERRAKEETERLRTEALIERERREAERVDRSEARRAERQTVQGQIGASQLALDVATKRLAYLRALETRLARMTDASLRILPSLGAPREALRGHAADLHLLSNSLRDASKRIASLARRAGAGMVVGFVTEQRAASEELNAAAASYLQQAERIESLATDLVTLAESLESEGLDVRTTFFRTAVRSDAQTSMDTIFESHLRSQRRLRKSNGKTANVAGREQLEALRAAVDSVVPEPRRIGTTADARQVLDAGTENRLAVESLLAAEGAGSASWSLAFENELVTVLSEQASDEARSNAYGFSSELIDDLRSEISLAWDRTRQGIENLRVEIPSAQSLFTTELGQRVLIKLVGLLGIVGAWFWIRRDTPKITVLFVKALARIPVFRGRVGLLVRLSGLLQSALPGLMGWVALHISLAWIDADTPIAHAIRALALPVVLYILGRQLIVGATRRITRGRPALIELRPETLQRLQSTYATIGIVVAVAYALDGIVRVIVGSGLVVSLLDGFALLWVGVWALFEAHRWRLALSKNWTALTPEVDPPSRERRVANWMGQTRLGAVLSPVALLRVVATPVARVFSGFASGTGLVQSLRAQWLRRRSSRSESTTNDKRPELPPEYLEAFPLYPILGEDDSLIVARTDILDQIVNQWKGWQETRADGSLVLIGEKGAGKTTLAAQIAHRANGPGLVQHTIAGKPTTRDRLVSDLAKAFGCPATTDMAKLTEFLSDGEDRLILLDEAHNVFLRHVDGYGAYDALVELVNTTTSKVFWIVVFNSFTWRFLNESRGRVHYFRKLMNLPKWTVEEIQGLIRLRNHKTGFELRFDEMLLSDRRGAPEGLELVEEAEGYFRLLWESSGGNPRIATQLWLSSLRAAGEKTLAVGLFPEPSSEDLTALPDDLIFSLAAICQHENLSPDEIAEVLNVSSGFARFATQFLSEGGYIEAKDATGERFTLTPTYYRAVLRVLRSRHLLFE
jgi:hypothetical protein